MKSCGILTISVGIMNYGNRLQNYALQHVLRKHNYNVKTIQYNPQYPEESNETVGNNSLNNDTFSSFVFRKLLYIRNRIAYKRKKEKFRDFTNNKIVWTKDRYTKDSDLEALWKEFDNIVCGSDQVWNPYWEGTQPIYFMQFMPYEKRIAYAASFGVEYIPDNMKDQYRDYFKNIKYISCREDRGREIVKELGSEAVQVLDPVFLIDPKEWTKIEICPESISSKKYILAYFLGDIEKETQRQLDKLSREGYRVIYLDRRDKINSIFASPEEFIYLVNHCSMLCTDSFHGCAFSIIFNRPFICYERTLNNGSAQNMNSRMTSLFNLFKCEDRFASRLSGNPFVMDYSGINKLIEEERQKSLEFLEDALNDRK